MTNERSISTVSCAGNEMTKTFLLLFLISNDSTHPTKADCFFGSKSLSFIKTVPGQKLGLADTLSMSLSISAEGRKRLKNYAAERSGGGIGRRILSDHFWCC